MKRNGTTTLTIFLTMLVAVVGFSLEMTDGETSPPTQVHHQSPPADLVAVKSIGEFTAKSLGDFTARADSPVPLTCVAADPRTGMIYAQQDQGTAFYRYDPFRDVWETRTASPINSGNNGGAAFLNGKIYTTFADNTSLGEYDIASNSWTTLANDPAFYTGVIASDGQRLYLVAGTTFKSFDPSGPTWNTLTAPPFSFPPWGGMAYWNGTLYAHQGNGATSFAKYDIASDSWTSLDPTPGGAVLGSAIDPIGSVYYAYGSYSPPYNIYAFDLHTETWSTFGPFPYQTYDGGMAHVGKAGQGGIYIVAGETGVGFSRIETSTRVSPGKLYQTSLDAWAWRFGVYDPASDTWRILRDFNTTSQMATATSGALFALRDDPAQIQVYDPASDSWTRVAPAPGGIPAEMGNLEVTPAGEFLYTESADTSTYYREYGGSWISHGLGFEANAQGDYDPSTGQYVIGEFYTHNAHLIAVDEFSFGKTSFTAGPGSTGEYGRFGVVMNGRYYYQSGSDPIRSYDLSNPGAPGTDHVAVPGVFFNSSAADRRTGKIFDNHLYGTTLHLIDPVANTATPLASGTDLGNHSSLAFSDSMRGSGNLYFSQGNNPAGLWALDTATGEGTWIGASAPVSGGFNSGLTISDDENLFVANNLGPRKLQIDGRGAGGISAGTLVEGLAFNVETGQLFNSVNNSFYEIDPTNGDTVATLAAPGFDVEGLAADPNRNVIYGIGDATWLFVYDVGTDFWNVVGNTGLTWDNGGLAYDPAKHLLYAISNDNGANLYSIDPDTAASTLIGPTGIPGTAFGGLAWGPGLIFADGFESGDMSAWDVVP